MSYDPQEFKGEKIETSKETFEMQEGGKLELVEVKRWNGREYRIGYGQIFKHTLTGSKLPFYMNHNYAICEKVFYDLRKQFKKKS